MFKFSFLVCSFLLAWRHSLICFSRYKSDHVIGVLPLFHQDSIVLARIPCPGHREVQTSNGDKWHVLSSHTEPSFSLFPAETGGKTSREVGMSMKVFTKWVPYTLISSPFIYFFFFPLWSWTQTLYLKFPYSYATHLCKWEVTVLFRADWRIIWINQQQQ